MLNGKIILTKLIMSFVPKKIFLADDDSRFRQQTKDVLTRHHHQVLIEAENGIIARQKIFEVVGLGIEVAVLDRHMPNETDGPEIAAALNQLLPQILIVSVSEKWSGVWPDPLYDSTNLHSYNINRLDINGRGPNRGPKISLALLGWNLDNLAKYIGEWQFTLQDPEGMDALRLHGEMLKRWQRSSRH